MASRSDQLHSHQFTLQRAVGALAMRDADPAASPMRRIGGALFASVMIAVLAVAAVGVYGLVRPGGGDAWREGRATIIERETGARYVLIDGVLYPVLNHTSAMLILGTADTVQVKRSELVGVPRGTPIGIPGAPDPLPGRDQLLTGAWTLCSRPDAGGSASGAGGAPSATSGVESVLRIGMDPVGSPVGGGGVLVADPLGGLHLLWNGYRFALIDASVVLAAFAWAEDSATAVPAEVLNAVPAGPDLAVPVTPRDGGPSAVPGLMVGEVFVVSNPDGQKLYGVALADGVTVVTSVQAALLIADNANGGEAERALSPALYADAPKVGTLAPTGADAPPPTTPPQVQPGPGGGVCAAFAAGQATPTLWVAQALPPVTGEVSTGRGDASLRQPVDYIAVPPGRGVIVESLASPGAPNGSLAVISDLGLRFAIPSAAILGTLGYSDVAPLRLPGSLVALVPAGRALDPEAAAMPATSSL
jgi:type VII secretion protein EccB